MTRRQDHGIAVADPELWSPHFIDQCRLSHWFANENAPEGAYLLDDWRSERPHKHAAKFLLSANTQKMHVVNRPTCKVKRYGV